MADYLSQVLQAVMRYTEQEHSILATIGDLCIEQLTMLRHRGAFSTVTQTFALCCEKIRAFTEDDTRQLNFRFYEVGVVAPMISRCETHIY